MMFNVRRSPTYVLTDTEGNMRSYARTRNRTWRCPGESFGRVDAYNRAGHIIGCNYSVKFRIGGGELRQG
jgi:hypothetical protein